MSKKSLVFVIPSHLGNIWHGEGDYLAQNELLFSAISETYLPLLNMFSNLEADGVPFKISMSFSPILCHLLSDPVMQAQYLTWIDNVIALGEKQLSNLSKDDACYSVVEQQLSCAKRAKYDFAETYQQDLLSKFAYYAQKGNLELLATAATNCYLPMYSDLPQAIQAQIEVGLISHRHYFNSTPDGFWLPYMGFSAGIDKIIRAYGFYYTILDAHGLLFGTPSAQKGIFSPLRSCDSSLAFFACDSASSASFDDDPNSYAQKAVYRNQNRDLGFELDKQDLSEFLTKEGGRVQTGYKFWSQEGDCVYDQEAAFKQAKIDALQFIEMKKQKLSKASELLDGEDVSSICCLNAEFFGQEWYESIVWFENVIRGIAENEDLELEHCSKLIKEPSKLQKIRPFVSSASGSGYAEDMIDHANDWMIRYVRKAVERMIDLTERFPSDSGLKERSLNLAAKEVLLAQSGDWATMIKDQIFDEYATNRFTESINAFTTVYESLGSNSISTEWLTGMERKHTVFPWINYRVFSSKR